MYKEDTKKLYYYWLSVTINFLGAIFLYVLPIAYIIFNLNFTGIFVVGGFISLLGAEVAYQHLNNFYRFLKHKPAIELSNKYLIDHTKNKIIAWSNIESMFLENRRSTIILIYNLKDEKVFFRQIKNPFTRILSLRLPYVTSSFTNLENVKGNNQDLFKQIVECKNMYKDSHNRR